MADDRKSEVDVPPDSARDKFIGDNTGIVTLSEEGGDTGDPGADAHKGEHENRPRQKRDYFTSEVS